MLRLKTIKAIAKFAYVVSKDKKNPRLTLGFIHAFGTEEKTISYP